MNNRGQFSIIAALLISLILVSTVILTYTAIRTDSIQVQPQVLTAIDETNYAIKQILGFSVGYFGSVIRVTGDTSFANKSTLDYTSSGLEYVANTHAEWGAGFSLTNLTIHTYWFNSTSYSTGYLGVTYNLTKLGINGVQYAPSSGLTVQIINTNQNNQASVTVTRDQNEPVTDLAKQNFKFFQYVIANSTWALVSPSSNPSVYTNGTYQIPLPAGIDANSYVLQVEDQRGIIVVASSFSSYMMDLIWPSISSNATSPALTVELLQNGTMRWLGQSLQLTTQAMPIPPLPIKSIHVNETINGVDSEVPFQIEDWASDYLVPLGMTSNSSVFDDGNMIVFLVNNNVSKVTVWWNGSDLATQTPYAFVNRYFTGDNPSGGTLTNGMLTLQFGGSFTLTSTVGSSSCTATFMRLNNQASAYGASPAYIIASGVVRDIVQQEAEWSSGAPNCPNLYAHIVLTLPANATYYTYQLRAMFVQSQQSRTITDLCPIRLQSSITSTQTENGTAGGYPIVSTATGTFYNQSAVWAHHWSQFISGANGAGIMFTDAGNSELYSFDSLAGTQTGGLRVNAAAGTIELHPVEIAPVSFTDALNTIWFGAVSTFSSTTPIYQTVSGQVSGSWISVEYPPTAAVYTRQPIVTNCGDTLPSYSSGGFAKYRVLGTQNIWVGTVQSINQTGATRTWTNPGNNSELFTYDPVGNNLQNSFNNYQVNYASVSEKTSVNPSTWNVIVITIRNNSPGTILRLDNVSLGSFSLGSFTVTPSNTNYWTITNYNFSNGFSMTGTIYLNGTFSGGSESNKIVIEVGRQ